MALTATAVAYRCWASVCCRTYGLFCSRSRAAYSREEMTTTTCQQSARASCYGVRSQFSRGDPEPLLAWKWQPSRSHLGCQTHQTYYFAQLQSRPPPWVACCAHQVQNFDLSQRFWCRGLWGLGFNEQIFGADEQNLGRGRSD